MKAEIPSCLESESHNFTWVRGDGQRNGNVEIVQTLWCPACGFIAAEIKEVDESEHDTQGPFSDDQ